MLSDVDGVPSIRERVAQACDTCKKRKVKCDGQAPCSYCKTRRRAQTCRFSPSVRRRRRPLRHTSEQPTPSPASGGTTGGTSSPSTQVRPTSPIPASEPSNATTAVSVPLRVVNNVSPVSTRHRDDGSVVEEEAEVPRDARLIGNAQGRSVFIGDCAPLSLFQTVRQIVTSRVDADAFAPETSRVSILENIDSEGLAPCGGMTEEEPYIDPSDVRRLVVTFLTVTSGIVDLFDEATLTPDIQSWANQSEQRGTGNRRPADVTSAWRYLVLAIGAQSEDETMATAYFLRGKQLALSALAANLSVSTVQSFLLTTMYMLRSCQINAAFLFFGIAARAAYAIGLHRTEVNSRFGSEIHTRRDRLWKSVRVLDLYLSISTGRPPAAADADCTVPYHDMSREEGEGERYDLLNASMQVLSLVERIIREVYSRRKISPQLTEGISRQLREWSATWLSELLLRASHGAHTDDDYDHTGRSQRAGQEQSQSISNDRDAVGACQVLCSYYYAVMLVSRPFLMYELCRRLPPEGGPRNTRPAMTGVATAEANNGNSSGGREKLANACIDAATLLVGLVSDFVKRGPPDRRMPLIVSWLFASSLVVGVGLLGDFGRALEKPAQRSVDALSYFAEHDAHAAQYARIASSLYACALGYLERRDAEERRRIVEDSTRLFGLVPETRDRAQGRDGLRTETARRSHRHHQQHIDVTDTQVPENQGQSWEGIGSFDDLDPAIFSFNDIQIAQPGFGLPQVNDYESADQVFGAINLFPLLDGNGHIDLAHLL